MRFFPLLPVACLLFLAFAASALHGGSPPALTAPDRWTVVLREEKADWMAVDFIDGASGWVAGERGLVLHTVDGGLQWSIQPTPVEAELRGVDFTDADHGWIVGGGSGMKRKAQAKVVHDPNEAIGIGKGPIDLEEAIKRAREKRKNWSFVLRTEDGGRTWEKIQLDTNFPLWGVARIDRERGWITSGHAKEHPDGHFHATADGGKTWANPKGAFGRPARPLYGIVFPDPRSGWTIGSHRRITLVGEGVKDLPLYTNAKGGVLRTTDGGETWEVQDPGHAADVYLLDLCFLDADRGWVVGEKGTIFATADAGLTWKSQKSGTKASLYAVTFTDEKTGLAAGQGGVLIATTDGGNRWKRVDLEVKGDLLDVAFPSPTVAVVVGEGGLLLRFEN